MNIYGELNGLPIEETVIAEIEENSSETRIIVVPMNITENTIANSSLDMVMLEFDFSFCHFYLHKTFLFHIMKCGVITELLKFNFFLKFKIVHL